MTNDESYSRDLIPEVRRGNANAGERVVQLFILKAVTDFGPAFSGRGTAFGDLWIPAAVGNM